MQSLLIVGWLSLLGTGACFAAPPPSIVTLPPASGFRVTLEDAAGTLTPTGPSCGSEAEGTLTCRGFRVTLTNVSRQTVWLSGCSAGEPSVDLEERDRKSGEWSRIGGTRETCDTRRRPPSYRPVQNAWRDLRLQPGETTSFSGRLLRPDDTQGPYTNWGTSYAPGRHTLRAVWSLRGCTEIVAGKNCLEAEETGAAVTEVGCGESCAPDGDPLAVRSRGESVTAPPLLPFTQPKLKLELTARLMSPDDPLIAGNRLLSSCRADRAGTILCVLLHVSLRNVGDHAIQFQGTTCPDFPGGLEYQTEAGEWKSLEFVTLVCSMTMDIDTPLPAGASIEEDLTPASVAEGSSFNPIRESGAHALRVAYFPYGCLASGDGSFCLSESRTTETLLSPAVTVTTTTALPWKKLSP
ncbi:hypothetical protein SAMN05421819_2268 [Bryocella elongata]|uniref:Uncharacterized protein n=1 Tax=Bryocella elongata TaxID=863522 RepID=A0A1H5YEC8_9BACT|nr:hypothetical protein [Bryocella elongata]SEG22449.1 hypothetical protein SAMN05421819_2268 [Bryocella elongata]